MSDPLVAQRLANGLQDGDVETATRPKSFDPPGPDLSGAEFIDLEIDNLSSLQMPQTALINPGDLPPTPTIPSSLAEPSTSSPTPAPVPQTSAQTGSQTDIPTSASAAVGTQSVMLPVGLTYYVTVPFTSERGLMQIRGTISEAFVRQFSDGNRVQLAAFDNAQSAQQFIEELKGKNISAEVYGPTTE
jgi:cell division septation protein DedD